MHAKRFAVIPIVAAGLMAMASAHAETFTFDGHQVVLEPPKGYCALDANRPNEQALIQTQQTLQAAYNEVVMVYADCGDLGKLRSGETEALQNYGAFQIAKQGGRVSAVSGYSRASYIQEVAKTVPQVDTQQIFSQLNDRSKNLGSGSIASNKFGLLESDQSAFYFGGMATASLRDGGSIDKISVNASTLINALPVAMSISRPSAGADDLKALLAQQHENMAALIQANAATDVTANNPQQGGFDWKQVLIAGVIGGLIGLTFTLIKRFSKKKAT